jgi:hypothetical protein
MSTVTITVAGETARSAGSMQALVFHGIRRDAGVCELRRKAIVITRSPL